MPNNSPQPTLVFCGHIQMQFLTFPRSCRCVHQSLFQFTAQLTSMFDEKTKQSQGCSHIAVIITILRAMLVHWLILYGTR